VEKELQENIQPLKEKTTELAARSHTSQDELQDAYDQGQEDCKVSMKKEVQNALDLPSTWCRCSFPP